jgi:acetyl-CoA decarbonylase/synthase complex subunit epsilon
MRSEIIKRGLHLAAWMSITDFTNRLQDPNWQGLHGEGRYDLVLLIGVPYSSGWLILSSLKHFSSDLTTVNLERFYQPNATCSFPNLTVKKWIESLKIILNAL